ncbi:MAG: TonB-dependent receptor, partial [Gemmatimonadaceae bacterium]
HSNKGAGDWHAPNYGSTAFSPDPIYFRQTQYDGTRSGVIAKARFQLPGNDLEFGGWYEHNESTIRRVAWRLKDYASGPAVDFSNVLALFFDRTGTYSTKTLYAQNTNTLLANRVKLTYGAKYLYIDADFKNNGQTIANAKLFGDPTRPSVSIPTDGGLLPQAGVVFEATKAVQLYGNFSQNVNAYPYSPQSGVYNTNPTAFDYFKANTKPEKSNTFEGGVRARGKNVEASLGAYTIAYDNRLIGVSVCPLTATCVSSFANVGSVTTRGVEGLLSLRLTGGVTWVTSGSLNDSKIADDYTNGTTNIPSAGKSVVDAPRTMVSSTLKVNRGSLAGSLGARNVATRYFSILNDVLVPAYTTIDVSASYTLPRYGALKGLTISANAVNLFDEKYISTMGTNGFTVSGDTETLMAGMRRLIFVSIGTRF